MTAAQVRVDELTRPIIGMENRTPLEVFDIMADRIRHAFKATAAAPGVPEGWVAVPREPTEAMVTVAEEANYAVEEAALFWSAMLAAAPTPPTTHQGGAAEMREAAARVAEEDSANLANDARLWRSERMNMAGDAAEQQSKAGERIAATIRALPLPAAEAPQGWRGIESAPKDGTRFIARGHDWGRHDYPVHVAEVVWNAERSEWRSAYNPDEALAYLTDWLCAAPSTLREGEGA